MKINKYLIALTLTSGLLAACSEENPIDREQYFKQIYLVGVHNKMQDKEVAYSSDEQEMFLSVAVGGSQDIDRDVNVTIAEAHQSNIVTYNKKYVATGGIKYQLLKSDYYTVPSYVTTIKSGDTYARIPLKIKTSELHCDSLYALPFKITSVSDYKINERDTVLIVTPKLVNAYSGTYVLEAKHYECKDGIPQEERVSALGVTRTLKAVNENMVRFYNKAELENIANIPSKTLTFSVDPTDHKITVQGWDELEIVGSEGAYESSNQTFTFWYQYKDGNMEYRVVGTLVK